MDQRFDLRLAGQSVTGQVLGVERVPVVKRQALPAYGNEIILMVKASSLASTITILEITGIAKTIIASSFRPVEVFIVAYVEGDFEAVTVVAQDIETCKVLATSG